MERFELRKWLLENAFKVDGNSINVNIVKKHILDIIKYTDFLIEPVTISRRVYTLLNDMTDPYLCVVCGKPYSYKEKRPTIYCNKLCVYNNLHAKRSSNKNKFIPKSSDSLSLRDWILQYAFIKSGNSISSRVFYEDDKVAMARYKEICSITSFFDKEVKISTRIYAILNGQMALIKCAVCGEDIKPNNKGQQRPFCSGCCASRFNGIRRKVEQNCLSKYGGSTPSCSDQVIDKMKDTCLYRYGEDNYGKTLDCLEKIKGTNQHKYGVNWSWEIEDVKYKVNSKLKDTIDKANKTFIDRYGGRDKILQRENLEPLRDPSWLKYTYDEYGVEYICSLLNTTYKTVYTYLHRYNIELDEMSSISHDEKNLANFIKEIIDVKVNSRNIIPPYELDIYIPEANIAIEYNGVYWHLEGQGKDKKYHLNKTLLCASKDIQLFHIFSSDDLDIWKCVIQNMLGQSQSLYARQTMIGEISSKEAKIFCDQNHLQGGIGSKYNYGLFYEGVLVSVMTFTKARFSKADYELLRFCTLRGYRVIGGAGKLLKRFKREHHGSIISYANMRWSNGKLYDALSFKLLHMSSPNYFYTKDSIKLYSRNKFQKHKLSKLLDNFYPDLTEVENMKLNGWDRIWDCGNLVYLLEK